MYVLALSFDNLVFGQRVIGMLVRAIFRGQDGRYSFSDGYLKGIRKKEKERIMYLQMDEAPGLFG